MLLLSPLDFAYNTYAYIQCILTLIILLFLFTLSISPTALVKGLLGAISNPNTLSVHVHQQMARFVRDEYDFDSSDEEVIIGMYWLFFK